MIKNEGIKTLRDIIYFSKKDNRRGGFISANEENYLIEIIKSAIEEHEAQLKAKDERIKELEEAMKPKTCQGCVHDEVEDMQDLHCPFCSRSCDDNFKPKDNA